MPEQSQWNYKIETKTWHRGVASIGCIFTGMFVLEIGETHAGSYDSLALAKGAAEVVVASIREAEIAVRKELRQMLHKRFPKAPHCCLDIIMVEADKEIMIAAAKQRACDKFEEDQNV